MTKKQSGGFPQKAKREGQFVKKRESRLKEGGMKEKWINCGEWRKRERPHVGQKVPPDGSGYGFVISFQDHLAWTWVKIPHPSHDIQMVSVIASLLSLSDYVYCS